MAQKPTIYLIDGSGYIYRAFYALRRLSTTDGFPTNAIYGFANMLLKVIREREPAYLAIAFDVGGETFRHELYPAYKANRPPPPEELPPQLPRIQEVVDAFQIPRLSMAGVEADDVLGTAALRFKDLGHPVKIITGDKDLMQLVDDQVTLIDDMRTGRGADSPEVTAQEVEEKFGVPPARVVDVLALAGDSSDNVPGVKGIGVKTAAQLVNEYGDLEAVLAAAPEIKQKARRERLIEHADDARLSKQLVGIKCDLDLNLRLDDLKYTGPNKDELTALFVEFEFTRLLDDPLVSGANVPKKPAVPAGHPQQELFGPSEPVAPEMTLDESGYAVATSLDDVDKYLKALPKDGPLAVHVLVDRTEAAPDQVIGLSVAHEFVSPLYVPVAHDDRITDVRIPLTDVLERIRGRGLVAADAKDALRAVLDQHGPELRLVTDVTLASYLLDPSQDRHNLEAVAKRRLGVELLEDTAIRGKGKGQKPYALTDKDECARYANQRTDTLANLAPQMDEALAEAELKTLYTDLELPLEPVLARMEAAGVLVDTEKLALVGEDFEAELADLEKRAYDAAGEEFNLQSPSQLAELLFDKIGLKVVKRTKTGASTDSSVLEQLADKHPLPQIVLEHRVLAKLKNTYIDVLPRIIRPDTGRVHTRFNQTVAATGRLSSSEPNLQNIPARTPLGRRIRQAFIAPPGKKLVSLDYSQIELRLLAHVTKDPVMLDTFQKGEDVHRRTAAEIFDKALDEVSKDERTAAKAINFGLLYGMGVLRLARELGIKRAEAKAFINKYFERYGGFRQWHDDALVQAKKDGFVTTLFGRRRLLPELYSKNRGEVARGERLAINTPIQGSAADIIKRAMLNADAALRKELPAAKLLLQVHDELLLEVDEEDAPATRDLVGAAMLSAAELDVPLLVDSGIGDNWAEVH